MAVVYKKKNITTRKKKTMFGLRSPSHSEKICSLKTVSPIAARVEKHYTWKPIPTSVFRTDPLRTVEVHCFCVFFVPRLLTYGGGHQHFFPSEAKS